MLHTLSDDTEYVVVGKGIEYVFSVFTAFDKLVGLEHSELMRYRCLTYVQKL